MARAENDNITLKTRRAALTLVAAIPALAGPAPTLETDPIFAAIEALRKADSEETHACLALDEAKCGIEPRAPSALVPWRRYRHIGGDEIESARDEFLSSGANPALIEFEYRKVKAAESALLKAVDDWYKQHGLTYLRAETIRIRQVREAAEQRLSETKPTTVAGAGALVAFVHSDIIIFSTDEEHWTSVALKNAADALQAIGGALT